MPRSGATGEVEVFGHTAEYIWLVVNPSWQEVAGTTREFTAQPPNKKSPLERGGELSQPVDIAIAPNLVSGSPTPRCVPKKINLVACVPL